MLILFWPVAAKGVAKNDFWRWIRKQRPEKHWKWCSYYFGRLRPMTAKGSAKNDFWRWNIILAYFRPMPAKWHQIWFLTLDSESATQKHGKWVLISKKCVPVRIKILSWDKYRGKYTSIFSEIFFILMSYYCLVYIFWHTKMSYLLFSWIVREAYVQKIWIIVPYIFYLSVKEKLLHTFQNKRAICPLDEPSLWENGIWFFFQTTNVYSHQTKNKFQKLCCIVLSFFWMIPCEKNSKSMASNLIRIFQVKFSNIHIKFYKI